MRDGLILECERIKNKLFRLPSSQLTVGQLLRLADMELFGLSRLKAGDLTAEEIVKLHGDFQQLRAEIFK